MNEVRKCLMGDERTMGAEPLHSSVNSGSSMKAQASASNTQVALNNSSTNESHNDTQVTATPALSPTSPSPTSSSSEKSTVTITPSTPSPILMPTMIITATKVTLDHRTGEPSSTESSNGSTETPVEESSTDSPVVNFSSEKIATSSNEVLPTILQTTGRQARFHRFQEPSMPELDESVTEPTYNGQESHESSTEFYRELDTDGGDSYGEYPEDNEIHEKLPTPMALINPNGEGNNPPLEDDFAEAFKKVNSNGKRRRFRGGRRGRMKLKKSNNDTNTQDSSVARQEDPGSKPSASEDVYYGTNLETTTPPSTQRPKRYRSTTPTSYLSRVSTTYSPPTSTEDSSERPTMQVVKNGPKPMILQSYSQMNAEGVTPSPQLERPGNGGHTEKISTYFFSTPSPSSRLRLRQKIRESFPSSTTTEPPTEAAPTENFPTGSDVWKNSFADFPQNTFFPSPTANNMKIPEFVPMDLGLETDDRQSDPIENSLSRPDPPPIENKAYSLSHQGPSSDSHSTYEGFRTSSSSTTPKSRRTKKPHSPPPDSYSSHKYDTPSQPSPTRETEKTTGTEYYAQGSNTEQATTFATSSQRPGAGSHYDRTKDKVVFFNDNPYSTQHSTLADTPAPDIILPGKAQTVGSHLTVADTPSNDYDSHLSPVNHFNPDTHLSMYSPGKSEHGGPFPACGSVPTKSYNASPRFPTWSGYPYPYDGPPHQPLPRPGGVYGTVEEVPLHSQSFESPSHRHIPPPPPGPIPYPFSSELPRPHHSPTMPFPPINSIPMSPHGDHGYHQHPLSLPPRPPPPPPHHHHHPSDVHSFAPSFEMQQPLLPHPEPEKEHVGNHQESSLSPSGSVDFPTSSLPNASPPPPETQNSFSGPQMDSNFPAHSHTMATHPDYEPANPPLPHDHPFHKSFVPFPPQEIHGAVPLGAPEHGQYLGDTNSISNGPYQQGTVDHLPTGGPGYDPSSPPAHDKLPKLEFTPIPNDVKDNDLFNYASKPHESAPHGNQDSAPSPTSDPSSHHGHEHHHEHHQHQHPSDQNPHQHPSDHHPHQHLSEQYPHPNEQHDPSGSFSDPTGSSGNQQYGPPTGNDNSISYPSSGGDPTKDNGYSGPVAEIHSGVYHAPNSEHGLNDHSHLQHAGGIGQHPGHEHGQGNYGQEQHSQGDYGQEQHSQGNYGRGQHSQGNYGQEQHSQGNYGQEEMEHHGFGGDKPHDIQSLDEEAQSHDAHNEHSHGSQGKKEGKRPFSNTPYVLMFPQLIPEEKMRPSPPSLLSKEIPVIQASSMSDFTSLPGSGEKPPLTPGFQAVPVHPRHQMYQVLAKTHYEKMMEKYMESKKRPPSAIYTPYGVLIPVGTNVAEAASSNNHVFTKPRHPPKFRGEKTLLNVLLGSPSSHGRFHPPNGYGFDGKHSRQNKFMEYEPAIDVLAEKLAMKIVAAQHALGEKGKMGSYSEHKPMVVDKSLTIDGKSGNQSGKSQSKHSSSKNLTPGHSASWYGEQDQMTMESKMNPELKEYLKSVLKGQLTEMIDTSAPVAPVEETRRPVALSSKLINSIFRKGRFNVPSKSMSMMPMSSASMLMPNKVLPPQGLHPNLHHGASMGGYGYPPAPQGPVGLLGTIKRLFNFGPGPHERHDISVGPNFAGRTLFTNGTYLPYLDGPSPRSSHYPQKMQMMMHPQYHLAHQQQHQQHQPTMLQQQSQHHLQYSFPPQRHQMAEQLTSTKSATTPTASSTTTTPKPISYSRNNPPPRSSYSSNNSSSSSSNYYSKKTSHSNSSPSINSVSSSAISSKSKGEPNDNSSKKSDSSNLNKRTGSADNQQSEGQQQQQNDKPTKLDMFQQLLGSTRSVLNFFKSEARNSNGPTVLKPRSATTSQVVETESAAQESTDAVVNLVHMHSRDDMTQV
ncbi:Translation initiation factor IF-2 [Orchesella cincta]|uniref:Translation initiation factor IF-2 n=1 Tax=Orchesella cincta TaxID=48709 RepID=A0A1D2NEK6_ORCCI|nr:Translation initiation factor IF-2 [Orchesella cincta]